MHRRRCLVHILSALQARHRESTARRVLASLWLKGRSSSGQTRAVIFCGAVRWA